LTAPSTSTHCSSAASAGDHSSAEIQNNQRNNDKEADFLSFITKISNSVRGLSDHFICPVCLDLLSDSHVAPECLHHFCGDCIKESLHRCKNECPACRSSICTRRSLRKDKSFDLIVSFECVDIVICFLSEMD
jgi:E3 ubiquitin-protein ligase RNF1/2